MINWVIKVHISSGSTAYLTHTLLPLRQATCVWQFAIVAQILAVSSLLADIGLTLGTIMHAKLCFSRNSQDKIKRPIVKILGKRVMF